MKVSIALHMECPNLRFGNQRESEAAYQNYNRQYADLVIDPATGDGDVAFNVIFPANGEIAVTVRYFSLGTAIAPPDLGGYIIICGPITGAARIGTSEAYTLDAACRVESKRLQDMGLIVFESGVWREKTEDELRVTYPKAA